MLKLESCVIRNGEFTLRADFTVPKGSRVAVIGPSGAGKSTLIEAIAGFRTLAEGGMWWQDRELTNLRPGKRPVAMLFQDGNLFPHLDAMQNVALGISPEGRLNAGQRQEVQEALARVGLGDMKARKPAELSGGQQSRVALARVLVQRRDMLLLDEPFAALGPALKIEMLDLVAELATETGTTVLMISHEPEDARRIADQAILVADNQAHAPIETVELLDNPPPALAAYLGNVHRGA